MSTHHRLLQILSSIVIITLLFSGFSLPTVSAQGKDGLRRQINTQTGKVSFLGPDGKQMMAAAKALGTSVRPQDPAMALARRFGSEFGLKDPERDLKELSSRHAENGRIITKYQQKHEDIPVMGGELIVNTNGNGDLYSMNGEISQELSLSTQPTIDAQQARETALQAAAKWYEKTIDDFDVSDPELWIYDERLLQDSNRPAELVWRMEVTPKDISLLVRELVLVNARRGNISLHFNQVDTAWSSSNRSSPAQDTSPTATPDPTETSLLVASPEPVVTEVPTEAAASDEDSSTHEGSANEITAQSGATWYVATTGNDGNSCSTDSAPCATIQAAITKAGAGDVVRVASGIYLGTSSYIAIISKSLTLSGGWNRSFTLQDGVSTIDGSGLRNGILANSSSSIVLVESFIIQNSHAGTDSGGISIYGANFTLKDSSLINNTAGGRGAGIYTTNNAALTILNSTISGNQAGFSGAGIYATNGTVTINNSTIAYNTSRGTGGGLAVGSATVSIKNSLLAKNTDVGGSPDCSGSLAASDHNILGNAAGCTVTAGPGDQFNIDPLIDPSLSGMMPLHVLQIGSRAIDAGDPNTCLAIDQRTMPRPQGSRCDIGAYEAADGGRLVAVSRLDQVTSIGSPFPLPLTVRLTDGLANPISGITIRFTAPASEASGTFADTGTNSTTVITDSNGQASASIFTANGSRGTYRVSASADGYSDVASFLMTNMNTLFVAPTGADSNSCIEPGLPCLTINAAIGKATPGDKIEVAIGTYTSAGAEVIQINKSVSLSGGWDPSFNTQSGTSTIDGQGARRGITSTNAYVVIDHFTIQNGYHDSSGGGLKNSGGNLTLLNSVVIRNVSSWMGGGIDNYGTLIIDETSIRENSAGRASGSGGGGGAGVDNYGGIVVMSNSSISNNVLLGSYSASAINNNGTFTLDNTTVSDNTGDDAIYNSSGTLILHNSTVTNNARLGIDNYHGTVILQNSILANNSTSTFGQDCAGTMTSLGHNLIGKTSGCGFTAASGDLVNINPLLNPSLVGTPPYHALLSTSPAIDAGDPAACLSVDQRGLPRPQGAACDIGAYEYMAPGMAASLGILSGNDQRIGVSFPFSQPLMVYMVDELGNPVSGADVTFTAPASGPSGTFQASGTNVTTVPVNSNGVAVSSTFTANSQTGTYPVLVTASGLSDSLSFVLTNSTLFVSPTGSDGNSCSSPEQPCRTLDAAVTKAASTDVIKVAAGDYTRVSIQKNLIMSGGWDSTFSSQIGFSTITGSGAVSGSGSSMYADAPDVSISRFILQNSQYGLYHKTGTLLFDQGAVINNQTGIYNADGDATFTNVTISGNRSSASIGSGIMIMNGNVSLRFSTISNNTGDYAIRSQVTSSAHVTMENSILAGNSSGDCYNPYRNLVSNGHNIFGRSPACSGSLDFIPALTDQLGINPQLSPLLPLGYHPLSSASPAIGNADLLTCPATDQRGMARPQGVGCDIGAYEYTPTGSAASMGIVSGSGQHAGPSLPFVSPLIVYVIDASGNPVSGVQVTFTAPSSGPGGIFKDTGLNTTVATTNTDGQAISPVFTANSQLGTYSVSATASGLSGSLSFTLTNAAWYVSTTGRNTNACNLPTSPCLTIDSAIYKAANGDGILVTVGTYTSVQVTKSVSILGGWDSTFSSQIGTSVIDGNVRSHGIYANAANIFVSRFVIQNSDLGIQHTSGKLSFERGALIHNDTGFYNDSGEATLTNTTISGNDAADPNGLKSPGSAIRNLGGVVSVRFSTITDNTGDYAIYMGNSSAHLDIGNSILAGNDAEDCYTSSNSITSSGHNLLGNPTGCSGSGGFVSDPTDQHGVDPKLSILLPAGYHALLSNSPAVGNADLSACPAIDQRGMQRPQNGTCDSGAYEYTVPGPAASFGIISGSGQHFGPSLQFPLPLKVNVLDAVGSPVDGITVTFTAPASGPSGTFADTGTNTTTSVTAAGGLATSSFFTANSQLGTYNVIATVSGLSGSINFVLTNAAWYVSTTGSDTNPCNTSASPCLTINAAIKKAVDGDAIKVAVGSYGPVRISKSLTVWGGWNDTFDSQIDYSTVDGSFTSDGLVVDGKDIFVSRFIVQNSVFGIEHSGAGRLRFGQGALVNNNNGIYNLSGDVFFTNTTISGNHSGDTNGYVYSGSAISNVKGLVRVQFSTITNNGGTEAIWSSNSSAHVEIGNSILAGNPRGDCYAQAADLASLGHNIFGSSPPCQPDISPVVAQSTDRVGVDPRLGALFLSRYHPLKFDSPAIDAANGLDCPAVDQRGATRLVGAACDIGAFEYKATATTPQYIYAYEGSPQLIRINGLASSKLVALVYDEDGDRVQGKTITFTAPDNGASVIFDDTGTATSTAVTDVNGFATSSAFSSNGIEGSYLVLAAVDGVDTPAVFSLSNLSAALHPRIRTYTANNFISLPGTFLCDESKPGCTHGSDVHADKAHEYAMGTYALYALQHSRNSINNAGMTIISSVHLSDAYANAAWTGIQMIYGDTYDFPIGDDVVAHELTHGVTQYESDLFYYYQSGAINESFSDVWGEYYDQINGRGNDKASVKWLIGEDVSDMGPLRSMSNPPAYGDPDKMSSANYYQDYRDSGGVHTNSGINNKAVFLMVDGGTFNGKTVAALGWSKTITLYYEVNTNLLSSGADYSDLYYALQQACTNLTGQKGITSDDCVQVKNAVEAVEMNGQPVPNFNTDAPYCDQGNVMTTVFSDDLESGTRNWTFTNGKYLRWQLDSPYGSYAHSGKHVLYADDYPGDITDARAQLISIDVPHNAYLRFAHAYDFEAYEPSGIYDDGGVLEYSVDGGSVWNDAGPLMDVNGYKGKLRIGSGGNPLQGQSAFVGSSHGYITTRVNLASLAGQRVKFRWRMGLDVVGYAWGWWVDDVQVYNCGTPNMKVYVGSQLTGSYDLPAHGNERVSYFGVNNGPIKIQSINNTQIVASERVAYSPDGGATWTSYSEMMGMPASQATTSYTFPWYNNADLNTQLRFANAGNVSTTVTVTIAGQVRGSYPLGPNQSSRVSYSGLNAGPVRVTSSGGIPIIASERVAYFDGSAWTSYSEMMGLPSSKLASSYIFPWYNNADLNSQLRFGNVGAAVTDVTVTIGGVVKGVYRLLPNESRRVSYPDLNAGPVKVTSSGGVPIIASMRVAYTPDNVIWPEFSEMMGMPLAALSTSYSFPVYNNVGLNTQLRFGNVGTSTTTVTVTIGGVVRGTYTLLPNASQRVSYPLDGGPVVIQSTGGVPIIASQRVAYFDPVLSQWTSFAEMMGLPKEQLTTSYLFPWYNNADLNTQLRFGVP